MSGPSDNSRDSSNTRLRPQRSGAPEGSAPSPGAPQPASQDSIATSRTPKASAPISAFLAQGQNPLLAAAGPLLSLGSHLSELQSDGEVDALRQEAEKAVRNFETRAKTDGVDENDVQLARFALCTFVDTAVYRTPWGAESSWSSKPLLVDFHGVNDGGSTFFEMLERMQSDPQRYIDLLELWFVCLQLGYTGRYRSSRGKLVAIQNELLAAIRRVRPAPQRELSPHWQGVVDSSMKLWRLVPLWVVAAASGVILASVWLGLRFDLGSQSDPVLNRFAMQSVRIDYRSEPQPVTTNLRLKSLLQQAERDGRLSVEEIGSRSVVTLEGDGLFASGSAELRVEFIPVIEELARAADSVPGRLVVVGHTDDLPIRSLRFRDNFELSRARARAVALILRGSLTTGQPVDWTGVGASEPRYSRDDGPNYRALNRRVEILHQASTTEQFR